MKYSDEVITRLVAESVSVNEVLRKLSIGVSGGMHSHITNRINSLGLDTSHFVGKSGNKNKTPRTKLTADAVLVLSRKDRREPAYRLRRALMEIGVDYTCSSCGLSPIWNGKQLTLEVDHINNDPLDNRRENVRFLCPNCHSQRDDARLAKR